MKKITAMLTALAMLSCCLVSCGSDGDDSSSGKNNSSSKTEILTEPEETEPAHHKALKSFLDAINNDNVENYMKFMIPQVMINSYDQDIYDMMYSEIDEVVSDLKEEIEDECGENAVVELGKILTETPLTKKYLDLAYNYFMMFSMDGYDDLVITEGFEVTFVVESTGDEGSSNEEATFCLIKVENDGWKIYADYADTLEYYLEDDDDDIFTTEAVTTTAGAVTIQTTTAGSSQTTSPATPSDYKISYFPDLDFLSLVLSLNPMVVGNEAIYANGASMLPSELYDKMSDKNHILDYNHDVRPRIAAVHDYVLGELGGDRLSLAEVDDITFLTDEELERVSQYYNTVKTKYGITDPIPELIGGYSADIYISSDSDSSVSVPVRMICVTDSTNDTAALPCGPDELYTLLP